MKRTIKTNTALCGLLSGLLLLAAGTSTASAGLIYSDSFTRSGNLNGSAPDVTNTPGQTWIALDVTTNGSLALDPENRMGFLPVTIGANNIYTLQADLDVTATTIDWLALGFSNTANTSGEFHIDNPSVGPWVLSRGDGTSDDQAWPQYTIDVGASGSTGVHTYKIVLNTMAAQWTAAFYRDSLQIGSTFTYSTNPTLSYVGFGNSKTGGSVDNFSFSEAVPEIDPNSLGSVLTLVLGSLGMLERRRLKAA
jgi:hypothetical protein